MEFLASSLDEEVEQVPGVSLKEEAAGIPTSPLLQACPEKGRRIQSHGGDAMSSTLLPWQFQCQEQPPPRPRRAPPTRPFPQAAEGTPASSRDAPSCQLALPQGR